MPRWNGRTEPEKRNGVCYYGGNPGRLRWDRLKNLGASASRSKPKERNSWLADMWEVARERGLLSRRNKRMIRSFWKVNVLSQTVGEAGTVPAVAFLRDSTEPGGETRKLKLERWTALVTALCGRKHEEERGTDGLFSVRHCVLCCASWRSEACYATWSNSLSHSVEARALVASVELQQSPKVMMRLSANLCV